MIASRFVNRFLIPIITILMFLKISLIVLSVDMGLVTDITTKLLWLIILILCIQTILFATMALDATALSDVIVEIIERRYKNRKDEL
jgi:TRAP-type mannitol/chloroaromatic compound transport system permease small subunit